MGFAPKRILQVSYQLLKKLDTKTRLGKRIISYLITEEYRKKLSGYFRDRSRRKMLRKIRNEKGLNLKDLSRTCLKHISPVTEPLALISQIQCSGGSLLSQLFDGHPEIHAHPHELMMGHKKKYIWPPIDLNDRPERWFEILFEKMIIEHTAKGYKKGSSDPETFPFILVPSLQKALFLKYLDSIQSITLRAVFDAYMTSYFGAWINNQNANGSKKFVTVFTPGLSTQAPNMEFFFDIYPDGRLISLVRDPKNWFPSALRHLPEKYRDLGDALSQWNESAMAELRNKEQYGDRVCIIKFEDLVSQTEAVMRYLAEFLGIQFDQILLAPTFNKFPIRVHTDLKVENHGTVNRRPLKQATLSEQEFNTIEKMTRETYPRVLTEAVKFQ
jgi:hypothetical protein